MAPPLRNARDANRGDRMALRALHLSLLNGGVFVPSRQMYVLSTAMTEATLDTMAARFDEALGPIAEAMQAAEPAPAGR